MIDMPQVCLRRREEAVIVDQTFDFLRGWPSVPAGFGAAWAVGSESINCQQSALIFGVLQPSFAFTTAGGLYLED